MMTLGEFKNFIKSQDILDVLEHCNLLEDEPVSRKICCPFHDENTPSLHFFNDGFYCFGCGENGDVFSFIMKNEDMNFMQVVRMLSEAYDKKVSYDFKGVEESKNKIDSQELEDEWEKYLDNLEKAPKSIKEKAEMFLPLDVGYDPNINYFVLRFTSKNNDTLGFTKRRIGDDGPKWKHSSKDDSNIHLCGTAFNLGTAFRHIRKKKSVIITEGPKDVIPWLMNGHKEVIAISGTNNFSNAISHVPEFDKITLSLDGDEAGRKATVSIIRELVGKTDLKNILVADVGELDPYDYWKSNGCIPEVTRSSTWLTDEEMKVVYNACSLYNQNELLKEKAKRDGISLDAAKSYFDMGTVKAKLVEVRQEDEKERLLNCKDPKALEKLRLKYGVE